MKLHGSLRSTCSQRVLVVAHELGIDLPVVQVNFSEKEHKSPAWLEKQPFGQIPYLDDDGFILFESRAIGRYLANKYDDQGANLLPKATDVVGMALAEQWMSVEVADFDPNASAIAAEGVFKPLFGGTPDQAVLEKHKTGLIAKLEGFERILAKQKYLSGKEVGLADLFSLPYGTMASKVYPDIFDDPSKPNVARWWKEISARPSWQKVLAAGAQ